MRYLRHFFVLTAAILLSACASGKVIEGDSVQARAGNAIAQAEIALTKGYRLVAEQAATGVLFKTELEGVLKALDQAAEYVDKAKKLYTLGNFGEALDQILDANKAMAYVEAEIAKKLRDRRQPVALTQPMSRADAEQACVNDLFGFLLTYEQLKAQLTHEQMLAGLGGPPKLQAIVRRLIKADAAGDKKAADTALEDLYAYCVDLRMNPETKV